MSSVPVLPSDRNRLETIEFHGDQLQAIRTPEGQVLVSVRRICESLGIDLTTQLKKLRASSWARMGIMPTPDERGHVQEQFLLDLNSVPMWLATINVGKVGPEIRPKLELFQVECRDALARHFGLLPPVQPAGVNYAAMQTDFAACLAIVGMCGLEGNQALLAADKGYRKGRGVSVLDQLAIALPSPENEKLCTPTELGAMLGGIGPRDVNLRLASAGLQVKPRKHWEMTPASKVFGVYVDLNKRHSDGTPIQPIRWKAAVLDLIRAEPAAGPEPSPAVLSLR